ncbi:hypothetical protein M0Q97_02110 [Candidatus Dojkabacteria bacterium]|jgi:hypothetical protein|nr:hypothetical protein [Candidatus Dojkabacteria bacterium]
MKNYNNYIFESLYPGIEKISSQQFTEYLNNLKDFKLTDKGLFRGVELDKNPFYIVNYTNRTRIIGSVLSLIMEFHKSWSEYPKRSKSIIFTNSLKSAKSYADVDDIMKNPMENLYRVIPFDDSKFGLAPDSNYKLCFSKCNEDFIHYQKLFYELVSLCDSKYDLFINPTWTTIKNGGIKIIKSNYTKLMNNIDKSLDYGRSKNKKSKLLRFNNADELIEYYFNPTDNGFKILNYKDLINNLTIKHEIWTDSPCLLARYDEL